MRLRTAPILKRPFLLVLVFGASFVLVLLSCAAMAVLVSEHVTQSSVRVAVAADQAVVADFVAANLTADELRGGSIGFDRRGVLAARLVDLGRRHGLEEIVVLAPDGTILFEDGIAPGLPGGLDDSLRTVLASGQPNATIVADGTTAALTEDFAILQENGRLGLVIRAERNATSILADAAAAWRDVVIVATAAAVVLTCLLYQIFSAANARLVRQDELLVEARRRDPLTGLLNHGTVVATLTSLMERAGLDGSAIGIALVDIDNFRLLNDVHGDVAGNEALMRVAESLEQESGPWVALGRYGPDEFLAIAPAESARELDAALKRVRAKLDAISLQFGGSEHLPVTISAGISYFPFHASAVIELVSAATIALGEAKASGGNDTRIANAWTTQPRSAETTFDVLQGLVFAVDTKDRYTKHHSEDVACYALFLADRIGLPDELKVAVRLSGLLHDVGKIGIPDDILRKPGSLTPHEYDVVKQHVALGDLIVRDLPDLDIVRAGIRHHHERWDGSGYLDGLAGEGIPLIARILAVGDAFSAMTTTRPYRKAIPVAEALERLREAAGSQLDETLVAAFVSGIETDPHAPLPGSDRPASLLWTPSSRAA
jgi:diguanylate cyclase (GGDEF)-like protein